MKGGWTQKTLQEVCLFENGDRGANYPSRSVQTTSGIPFINAGHLTEAGIDFTDMNYIPRERFDILGNGKIRRGDILFCLRGSLGKFASVGDLSEGSIASSLVIVRPKDSVLNKFILAYFQSHICAQMIDQFKNGAAQPNLSAGSLKKFLIPIPPLSEQQRIVGILDEAFEDIATARANAEKNIQNARALIPAAFMAVLSSFDQTEWQTTTVERVASKERGAIRTGPFGSQLLHSEFVDQGIPVLGIDNAVLNRFGWNQRRYITHQKFSILSRYQVKPGDVLITIMGTCGRCAVVPKDIPTAINSKHLCCITLDKKKCLPEYLHSYFLYHSTALEFLSKQAKGAIMAGLNMGIIKELPLVLPTLEQQRIIVDRATQIRESLEDLEVIYKQKMTALEELKKSLLHQAFSGQL